MIVVDTSALIAILKNEETAAQCASVLENPDEVFAISAASMTEMHIVAIRKGLQENLRQLLASLTFTIIEVDAVRAELAAAAYARFGKGFHPASLNFGDCFSYATAREFDCPLLFVGNDFAKTDIIPAVLEQQT